jgi:hypothetical protein
MLKHLCFNMDSKTGKRIMAMITAGIKPLIGIELWAYNEDDPGALGNDIDFRNGLEAKTGMDWQLWIDQ